MHLTRIEVTNFRAIRSLTLDDLTDLVVLAGPNGCGKSCVLDAIRLIKSAYGSYMQNEWQNWFGEFQISFNEPGALLPLFQDKTKELRVAAQFRLSEEEKVYLRENLETLERDHLWSAVSGGRPMQNDSVSLATTERIHRQQIETQAKEAARSILPMLEASAFDAVLTVSTNGEPTTEENPLLERIFRTYLPMKLGVVDFHGANRNYNRERLGAINLTLEGSEQRQKQTALYNSASKYANLKSEMAGAYVRNLLAQKAAPELVGEDPVTTSLKELFVTFFPGKKFLGPRATPDGRLEFPVGLGNGAEHDLDELSSGEKEVLYGYLRLRSAGPRNSIVLIDEPELHLNPRLISGLATFYHRHLGLELNNQLWLVTHSDTLIREAVARGSFSVFHLQPIVAGQAGNQATRVQAKAELEGLVIDLVGDLAAYRPGGKMVIFESTEDAAFDAKMTRKLFPEFERSTNSISAGDKTRVASLYCLLEKLKTEGQVHQNFFAITDPDDDLDAPGPSPRFQWDVYHIENYLLVPRYILQACRDVGMDESQIANEEAVHDLLLSCAKDTIPSLVSHKLRLYANRHLMSAVELGFDPNASDLSGALQDAVTRCKARLERHTLNELSSIQISRERDELVARYEGAVDDGTWRTRFRGRDVLKRFSGRVGFKAPYEYLRDLILSKMHDDGYRPIGMKVVVDKILAS